jgi:outer membrane receptor protein involved in Fe transport
LTIASAQAVAADQSAEASSEALTEVVVTGSRVVTNGNEQPTPVTVIPTEQLLTAAPTTVVAALQELPVFAATSSPTTDAGNSSQNRAARSLNLRALGANRTLVLMDGTRVAPISQTAGIDVSYMPSMLLQRVDVVTGGASAVYGSDAVAGVVNFVSDRNFNGVKVDAHYGISAQGDAEEDKAGIAAGMSLFGGRGHIEGEYEYYNDPGIPLKQSRSFGAAVYTVQNVGTALTGPQYELITNTRISTQSADGLISNGPLAGMEFSSNGVLTPFNHGTSVVSGIEQGGDGVYYDKINLGQAYGSNVGYGRFDFDISDTTHLYATVGAYGSFNFNTHFNREVKNIKLSTSNAFLSQQYQTAMAGVASGTFTFSRFFENEAPTDANTHSQGQHVALGVEGKVGSDYKWEVFYSGTHNTQTTRQDENGSTGRLYAAIDAVKDSNGNIVCNVSLTNPGLYPGCVPLNMFGPTAESQQAMNWIYGSTEFKTTTNLHELSATISGPTFRTWAGPIQSALSGEFRRLTFETASTAPPGPVDCTGLRFGNCTASSVNYQANVLANQPQAVQKISEVALETNVPLAKDLPIAKSVNFIGAVRYTAYNNTGVIATGTSTLPNTTVSSSFNVDTWKLGLDWDVNDQLKLRGTRSLDIRAPTPYDMFAPRLTQVGGNFVDLHVPNAQGNPSQAPNALQYTDGNPALVPEVGRLWSAGMVYTPSYLPGFSVSADWYMITIGNAIQLIQTQGNDIQSLCETSGGTSPFCALILRPLPFSDHSSANLVTAFILKSFNTAVLQTKGWDFEANYGTDLPVGRLNLRALVDWQPHLYSQPSPTSIKVDQAGTANPDVPSVRATLYLQYIVNDFTVDLRHRYMSKVLWDPNPVVDAQFITSPQIPSIDYTDITLGYKGWKHVQPYLSVQNVFNRQPSAWANTSGSNAGLFGGFVQNEDLIGRYYTIGVRAQL